MASIKARVLRIVPPQYRHKIVEFKNALRGGFRQYHYSQFGEDIFLTHHLSQKDGFFVDVGANHPSRYSNTKLLYQRGWRGINIEPNGDAIRTFRNQRPRDISLQYGVAQEPGIQTFYRFSDPAMNTFSADVASEYRSKKWLTPLEPEQVEIRPLAAILADHLSPSQKIDLLNVDAEGYDLEILRSNDWVRFRPRVIAVEAHDFKIESPRDTQLYEYLQGLQYEPVAYIGPTLIWNEKSPISGT